MILQYFFSCYISTVALMVITIQTICGHSQEPIQSNGLSSRHFLEHDINSIPDVNVLCASDVRCRCNITVRGGLAADCSNLNISVIPYFHQNVTEISLRTNDIKTLKVDRNQVPRTLLYLDISENKLEKIVGYPFINMANLLHLDLSHNFLQYTTSVFSHDVFDGLKNLTYLNLKCNNHNDRPSNLSYPVSIGNIKTLKSCLLDGVDQAGFSGEFKALIQLESMDLEGHTGVCTLPIIRNNYFENVSGVQHLNLSYCDIRNIEIGTLRVLTKLYSLNISHNDRLTFSVLSNLTDDIQTVPVHTVDMSKLHCDYGPGIVMYVQDIEKLSNHTYLTDMRLDNNRLSLPETGVIPKLPKSLRRLSVRQNRLTYGSYIFELASAVNLEFFDGSNQYFSHDPNTGSRDCKDWRAPPDTNCTALFFNGKVNFDIAHLSAIDVRIPPNLKQLIFYKSALDYVITGRIPLGPNNLTLIDLHSNLIHSWKGTVSNLQHVKYIDGSNNYCTFISDDFFNECPNLETLLIHDNLLGDVLRKDQNGNIFRHLTHLKVLDLSWNRIQTVPKLLLKNQNELQILNVSNNQLDTFDLYLKHMTGLTYLNLSHNQLQKLGGDNLRQINGLTNLTVNLYGNKLQCSCETLDFLKWLSDNKAMFDHFRNYECQFPNDTRITFADFDKMLIDLKKSCYNYTGLIAGVTSSLVLIIAFIVSGIVYRYRWKLRYLYYMTKTRYRGYTGLEINNDTRHDYPYDAFISYCEQDGRFVRGDLLDNLETRCGLTLCLHQRDFIPGQDIAENITKAIHQSWKTVVVLSKNYLRSYWCLYEFNMARMESIYSRGDKPVLLLVFYDDVAPKELPLTLMDLIERKSYIEYPKDEQGNIVFWDKLAESVSM
nr:Toll-like receptor protein [Mimachlamys nobilis]